MVIEGRNSSALSAGWPGFSVPQAAKQTNTVLVCTRDDWTLTTGSVNGRSPTVLPLSYIFSGLIFPSRIWKGFLPKTPPNRPRTEVFPAIRAVERCPTGFG